MDDRVNAYPIWSDAARRIRSGVMQPAVTRTLCMHGCELRRQSIRVQGL